MYPALLSSRIRQHMKLFLQQMFPVSTPYFRDVISGLTERDGGVFQGPWHELNLPFLKAEDGEAEEFFTHLRFPFRPHRHQAEAFRRLCGEHPLSTLVATGTGSGKTECFLYPILEHCAKARSNKEPGIKAVILYPMNALATDQARRFAAAVHHDPALHGIRVGMYVGGDDGKGSREMSAHGVITDRMAMKKEPPDVLLTNYKMLDYLLVRREDSALWQKNKPETLRYLAVDELHTFDGAQATDLACLIRRLKQRLDTPSRYLCCVGTSATMGGDDKADALLDYAKMVFGEPFDPQALIRETAMTPQQFRGGADLEYFTVPGREQTAAMEWEGRQNLTDWLRAQSRLWFDGEVPEMETEQGRLKLGEMLLRHRFLSELLFICHKRHQWVLSEQELTDAFSNIEPGLTEQRTFRAALGSFLSLCAHARRRDETSGRIEPFLRLRTHLWMRELSGMVSTVTGQEPPTLAFQADLPAEQKQSALTPVYCLDCGRMSWGCLKDPIKTDHVNPSRAQFSAAFFNRGTGGDEPCLLTPLTADEKRGQEDLFEEKMLCGTCMRLRERGSQEETGTPCPRCGTPMVRVLQEKFIQKKNKGETVKECPACNGKESLIIVGSRSASMNSAAIETLFASPCNDDKKLVTFSDSVQDASHRAGFFTGRSYKMTQRIAFTRALSELSNGKDIPLSKACAQVGPWWQQRQTPEVFVSTFMPPDKEWLNDYEELVRTGKLPSKQGGIPLPELICQRLEWDLFTELSWRCCRGRTLERSGCFILTPRADALQAMAEKLALRAKEHLGSAYALPPRAMQQWLTGMAHWMRLHGAILTKHTVSFAMGSEPYRFNRKYGNILTKLKPYVHPRLLCPVTANHNGDLSVWAGGGKIWPKEWTQKMPWPASLPAPAAKDFLNLALKLLCEEQFLLAVKDNSKRTDDESMGLNPKIMVVTPRVCAVTCSHCAGLTPIPEEQKDIFEGMPCLKYGCPGTLSVTAIPDNASRNLYETGEVIRLRAKEHTGLLERKAREELENSFIHQTSATAPNLLSCTPTLEMGIDIGDLSSVLLCSVPPGIANFRQRTGRAGRRDGNAFTLTTANNRNHDLYFFHAPETMIRGQASMPGIFLKAPAILERQLFAFCLDQWIKLIPNSSIPKKLQSVLNTLTQKSKFPQNLFQFISEHTEDLLSDFFHMLDGELNEDICAELEQFMREELTYRISSHLHRTFQERENYNSNRNSYKNKLRKLRQAEESRGLSEDEEKELSNLEQAYNGVCSLIRDLNKKDTLGFLTDEGLLPNYAFPEEGVTLHSIILKKRQRNNDETQWQAFSTDYVRAAASAITELAPGNVFYVEGHKVLIDQINLKSSEEEDWVFCPACSHMERAGHNSTTCPRCGADWSDVSHRRSMIRLNQVMATSMDERSRSLDDQENRTPTFYSKQMAVSILDEQDHHAWATQSDRVTFAFQYVQRAMFREINLGNTMLTSGGALTINGKDILSAGFDICAKCGKLAAPNHPGGKIQHDYDCPNRTDPKQTDTKKTLLLYRELQSEAIRLILPNTDEGDGKDAFMSALILGLKEYFKGDIGHLKICEDSIRTGDRQNKCLVIYDSVPGGTGYLKELCLKPENMFKVLQLSLDKMECCPCAQEPDKDGCHLCILSARKNKDATPSRRMAMKLLRLILDESTHLKELSSLSETDINPLLGSELETQFLHILKAEFRMEKRTVNGTPGFLLFAGEGEKERLWEVQLQKDIQARDVKDRTVPDFMFTPLRQQDAMPIAVYLDGKTWHANEATNRISGDIRKREALRRDKYLVWTLTWDDLNPSDQLPKLPLDKGILDTLKTKPGAIPENRKHGVLKWLPSIDGNNSLSMLEFLLRNGSEQLMKDWRMAAGWAALSFSRLQQKPASQLYRLCQLIEEGDDNQPEPNYKDGEQMIANVLENDPWRIVSMISSDDLKNRMVERILCRISFNSDAVDDSTEFIREWRAFWYLYNLLQVLPNFRATTPELGRDGYRYENRSDTKETPTISNGLNPDELEELEPDWIDFLCHLEHYGEPEPLFEITDNRGNILGVAEVAWVHQKLVLLREDDTENADTFAQQGWTVLMWNEPKEELTQKLNDLLTISDPS